MSYEYADIRCGLIMSIKINASYIETLYSDFMEGGELKNIGDEETQTDAFWQEFSQKITNMYEKWNKQDREQEICYLFQEHLNEWKDYFEWFIQEESDEEEHYCGHLDHIYGCRCDEEEDE